MTEKKVCIIVVTHCQNYHNSSVSGNEYFTVDREYYEVIDGYRSTLRNRKRAGYYFTAKEACAVKAELEKTQWKEKDI